MQWAAPKLQTSYKRMQLRKKGKGLRNKNRKKIAKKLPSNRRRNRFFIFKQKSTESKLSLYLSGGDLQNYFQKMQFKSLFKSPIMLAVILIQAAIHPQPILTLAIETKG